MLSRFAQRLTLMCIGRPGLTVLVFGLLSAIGVYGSSKLEMRLNYLELLPENDEAVQDLHWMLKKAGSEGYLVTGISGGSREQRIAYAEKWTEIESKKATVRYAEYRYDVGFFRKHAKSLLPLETLQELRKELDTRVQSEVAQNFDLGLDDEAPIPAKDEDALAETIRKYEEKIPAELIESKDKTEIFTLAKPAMIASDIARIHDMLKEFRADLETLSARPEFAGVKAQLGGPPVFQESYDKGIRGDLGKISIASLLFSAIFLLVATRRPIASLLILLPVACAISVTLAVAAATIGHLTIVSGVLVAVLLGLGVEFGIHLLLRTSEARAHKNVRDALLAASPETMEGAFSGAVTNGAAFLVLVACQFKAFREFGAIAACGVLLSWLFSYALLPAMLLLVEKWKPGWALHQSQQAEKTLRVPAGLALTLLTVIPLFCVYGAFSIAKIETERSFAALQGSTHPDPIGVRAAQAMNATLTPAIAWLPNVVEAKKLEKIFDELRKNDSDPLGPSVSGTLSLGRVVHEDSKERDDELQRIRVLLKRVPAGTRKRFADRINEVEASLDAPTVGIADIPEAFARKFTPLDGDGTFVLVSNSRSLDNADNLDAFVAKVEEGLGKARADGLNIHLMSENRIAVRIFRQVFADAPFIAWAAMLVALLTLFALLRSVRETIVVFTPIALGMLFMVGAIRLVGVKLNFINMAVIPSIFTVAIDNTVHLYHRYAEEGRAAMPTILRHTGAAVLIATCVNASGYGPTLLAHFYGLKSFGIVAMCGMVGMLLATVVWFPLLLMRLPERPAPAVVAQGAKG